MNHSTREDSVLFRATYLCVPKRTSVVNGDTQVSQVQYESAGREQSVYGGGRGRPRKVEQRLWLRNRSRWGGWRRSLVLAQESELGRTRYISKQTMFRSPECSRRRPLRELLRIPTCTSKSVTNAPNRLRQRPHVPRHLELGVV